MCPGRMFSQNKLLHGFTTGLDDRLTGAEAILFIYSCVQFNKFFVDFIGDGNNG